MMFHGKETCHVESQAGVPQQLGFIGELWVCGRIAKAVRKGEAEAAGTADSPVK
jgi:hypothetical protein